MRPIKLFTLVFSLWAGICANAQTPTPAKYRICMDVAHQQRFWHDPADMAGMDVKVIERVKYMTGEFVETATSVDASLSYLKEEIKPKDLEECDLLFIHTPSAKYTPGEVSVISKHVGSGGSLFLVMDQDMWSTLEQTNVNDLIRSFGIQFGGESPDSLAGGHTRAGLITDKSLKISYHGARTVTGGTPFCFNDRPDAHPFGTFMEVENGGKIIVMGDGMVSLYMTSWEGVDDYQCQEFMQDVFRWLLK
ncbi:MAG: hypothetical protein GEV06_10160 [Luteitalea sp.]|nr:hypothetical protein [Luteitalea sp.]